MPIWLVEFLTILAVSNRTQWAIILGFVFFIGIHLMGDYVLSHLDLQVSVGLQEIIVQKIAEKYDKAALVILLSFLVLAYRYYKKDKKKFW